MKEFIVVTVSVYGDEEEDPNLLENNIKHPELVQYVEEAEQQTFVVNATTGNCFPAPDFFVLNNIKRFQVLE